MMMLTIDIISSFRKSTFSPLQQLQIPRNLNVLKHGKKQVMCCSQTHNNMTSLELSRSGRRQAVCQIVALFSALPCMVPPAWAAESEAEGDYELYKDETDKFSLLVPQDWIKGKGKADGQRMVTAFFPENDEVSNVNVIITGLGADYTRMESFGPVDAFAETLVNSLDRSWKRPPGQAAKLLNAKSKNGMYYVEYSLQKPGESKIHLFSTVGMAFGDWYNRLYTVTGQFLEEDADKYKAKIEKIQIQANKVALEVDHLQTLLLHWGKPHVMLLECLRLLLGAPRLLPVVFDTTSLSVVLSTVLAAPRARCINEVTHQLATTFINSLAWLGLATSSAWVGLSSCRYCTS